MKNQDPTMRTMGNADRLRSLRHIEFANDNVFARIRWDRIIVILGAVCACAVLWGIVGAAVLEKIT